jgi:hypothetical protein
MIRVVSIAFLLLAGSLLAKSGEPVAVQQWLLSDADQIRSEAQAARAAIASLGRTEAPAYYPMGVVLQLSKAHREIGGVSRGDVVWLVQVINRGASDLTPVPEGLVWVRARDGVVARL